MFCCLLLECSLNMGIAQCVQEPSSTFTNHYFATERKGVLAHQVTSQIIFTNEHGLSEYKTCLLKGTFAIINLLPFWMAYCFAIRCTHK